MRRHAEDRSDSRAPAPRPSTEVPRWTLRVNRALAQAASTTRVIPAATPTNLGVELTRLVTAVYNRAVVVPAFEYQRPRDHLAELARALERLADDVRSEGELGVLYADRALELALEARVCDAIGTPRLREVAAARFLAPARELEEADRLADVWSSEVVATAPSSGELVRTDDAGDPRSLVSALRRELGARGLPFRVVTSPRLSALAATGDGVVIVVAGRTVTIEDVARTVVHEIEGHVEPATRAARRAVGLFSIGTASGSDDQEGRALHLEAERGYATARRRRELGLRHLAARSVYQGASLADTVELLRARRVGVEGAVHTAGRGPGGGGLAREVVYLPALLRVRAMLSQTPHLEPVIGAGRVSVAAAPTLARWQELCAA